MVDDRYIQQGGFGMKEGSIVYVVIIFSLKNDYNLLKIKILYSMVLGLRFSGLGLGFGLN